VPEKQAQGLRRFHGVIGRLGRLAVMTVILLTPPLLPAADERFRNPVLAGGYPDPSICRNGEYWYLVNSTFEYFPGLPIHRSRDLVNWELVGYGLHRESQVTGAVNLVDVQSDGGIHAPTIRCGNGRFFIVSTNVYLAPQEGAQTQFVNFVITADRAEGPWSEPQVIDGAPGIDPDLFFDDDGRVWYVGTHVPETPSFPGEGEIWLQQIDPDSASLLGERHFLWRGACGGVWAEGPHLYKRDGRYYLVVAEGGTSFNHAVMVAVSDEITGPYQSNPRNPVLTSRHLGYDHWVNSTGHADLFELPDGRWYLVALGIRGDQLRRSNMGRETFLVPVEWEREPFEWKAEKVEWPVASPLSGRVEQFYPLPFIGHPQQKPRPFFDDFDATQLQMPWNFRRVPLPGAFSLDARPGFLRLRARPETIRQRGRAALLGFRQTESDFEYAVDLQFTPRQKGTESGLILFQKDDQYLALLLSRTAGGHRLRLLLAEPGKDPSVLEESGLPGFRGEIVLRLLSRDGLYRFEYRLDDGGAFRLFSNQPADQLLSRGYTGAYLGVYSTSNGQESEDFADVDWVRYTPRQREIHSPRP
jgi:alpha-N-arabinofuranosidase